MTSGRRSRALPNGLGMVEATPTAARTFAVERAPRRIEKLGLVVDIEYAKGIRPFSVVSQDVLGQQLT